MSLNLDADFLQRRAANHRPLTPLTFLYRAAEVFPERTAIIHGDLQRSWRDYERRCRQLGSALARVGIRPGDTVAVLAFNTPAMLEAHFGVPMAGGVLNTLNTRLDAAAIAFILTHSEAKVFLVDTQLSKVAAEALVRLTDKPLVIDIEDLQADNGERIGTHEYEAFLQTGSLEDPVYWPTDEFEAISLNYTSGTTGNPKGVLYHHRGVYLNALSQVINHGMNSDSVYLWTLPMFHCNGWCFSWAVAALGGTHVCLRKVAAEPIFEAIEAHGVTHLCCAPTVLSFLIEGAEKVGKTLALPVAVMTAGAAPPAAVLRSIESIGFRIRHVYGMTEMHGVASLCEWQPEWSGLPAEQRARLLARQGVRSVVTDDMIVANPQTLQPVPRDGTTLGEVLFRGNLGMKGYLKNPQATEEAFAGGWYHSGDLAVIHPDGYMEIKDRLKDIIISGGENISSIEVEDALYLHPAVLSVAVVARKDDRWGEVPCAFVELKPEADGTVTADDIISHCRTLLARFKCPRQVIFGPIERTATGKIQKFKLRSVADQTPT